MNIIEQFLQITPIIIKSHILPHIVDEMSNFPIVSIAILHYVSVTQVLDILVTVHEAIEQCGISGDVLGARLVALLVGDAVQQEGAHEIVDCDGRHLDHSTLKFDHQEAFEFLSIELDTSVTKLRHTMYYVCWCTASLWLCITRWYHT